jgi:hypothetical protein
MCRRYHQISISQGVPSGWISECNHDNDKSMSHLKVTFKTCQVLKKKKPCVRGEKCTRIEPLSGFQAEYGGAMVTGYKSGAQRWAHPRDGSQRKKVSLCRYSSGDEAPSHLKLKQHRGSRGSSPPPPRAEARARARTHRCPADPSRGGRQSRCQGSFCVGAGAIASGTPSCTEGTQR